MSTEKDTKTTETVEPKRVETEVITEKKSYEATVGKDAKAIVSDGEAVEIDVLGEEPDELEDKPEVDPSEEDEAGDKEQDEGEASDEEEVVELPDYDPEAENFEDIRQQYDKKYFTEEGKLNTDILSTEYWANFEKVGGDVSKASLPEGTYKYLRDALGMDKDQVKVIEASLVAKHMQDSQKLYAPFGGVERVQTAVEWAKAGGYNEAQREKFNKAQKEGGENYAEQLELLMSRFRGANKGGREEGRRGPPGRRQSSPQRSVTTGGGAGQPQAQQGDTFSSISEFQTALQSALKERKEASRSGDQQAFRIASRKVDDIHKKARRSKIA